MTLDMFNQADRGIPLPAQMRPDRLDQVVGQKHLLGRDGLLGSMIRAGQPSSMILWGPPGTGKTTIARLIAQHSQLPFQVLNAVSSGVGDIRKIIGSGRPGSPVILFIDEIHRFNKGQQAALLEAIEEGSVILIGATTENPGFEVIPPLLSRCHLFTLQALSANDLNTLFERGLNHLSESAPVFSTAARELLINHAGGDARRLLKLLELIQVHADTQQKLDTDAVRQILETNSLPYDKKGEYHYDLISAFIKSVRGSDPDAALYYMFRMLNSGEDPLFIARRLIILASEDIGNAAPYGLTLATSCFDAVHRIGMPEAMYPLSQTVIYLAASPKSNSAAGAALAARDYVKNNPDAPVPLHLRNAANSVLKAQGYGDGYRYPHDYPGHVVKQQYLPDGVRTRFYEPVNLGQEQALKQYLDGLSSRQTENGD